MTDNRDEKGSVTYVQVVVAFIGLAGVLGGAFFTNYDKIFQRSNTSMQQPNPDPKKSKEWTNTVNTPNGTLLYDARSGSAAFEQFGVSSNRSIITPYPAGTFPPRWTHIVSAPNGILFYNTDTGEAVVGRVDNLGNYTVMKKYSPYQAGSFAPGWTNIVYTPEGIRYKNAQTGAVAFGQIDPDRSTSPSPPPPSTSCERLSRQSSLPAGTIFQDCKCCPKMVALPDGSAISQFEVSKREYKAYINSSGKGNSIIGTDNRCYVFKTVDSRGRWEVDATINWENPGFTQDNDEPVVCVSWYDATSYINWLHEKSGAQYTIPTKDNILYATQADSSTKVFWTNSETACVYANINDEQSHLFNKAFYWDFAKCNDGYPKITDTGIKQTAGSKDSVEKFKPNKFGIYHLIGNVYEWLSTDEGCDIAGQIWIWGGSWTAAPDKAVAAPSWCQSKEFKAIDIGIRVFREK